MGKGSIGENRGAGREGAAKEVRDGLGSSVFNVQIGQIGWPLLVVNLIYQAHETAGAENSSLERAAAAAVEGGESLTVVRGDGIMSTGVVGRTPVQMRDGTVCQENVYLLT